MWSDLDRQFVAYVSVMTHSVMGVSTAHAVTLSGSENFRGFLIVAVNGASQRVGSWSTGSDARTTCDVSTYAYSSCSIGSHLDTVCTRVGRM